MQSVKSLEIKKWIQTFSGIYQTKMVGLSIKHTKPEENVSYTSM